MLHALENPYELRVLSFSPSLGAEMNSWPLASKPPSTQLPGVHTACTASENQVWIIIVHKNDNFPTKRLCAALNTPASFLMLHALEDPYEFLSFSPSLGAVAWPLASKPPSTQLPGVHTACTVLEMNFFALLPEVIHLVRKREKIHKKKREREKERERERKREKERARESKRENERE